MGEGARRRRRIDVEDLGGVALPLRSPLPKSNHCHCEGEEESEAQKPRMQFGVHLFSRNKWLTSQAISSQPRFAKVKAVVGCSDESPPEPCPSGPLDSS